MKYSERRERSRLRIQSKYFRQLVWQLHQCREYLAKADRTGNRSEAAADRRAELSRINAELAAMGAWDNRELYD